MIFFVCVSVVSIVISLLSIVIFYFSLFFFMSLAKGLLILLASLMAQTVKHLSACNEGDLGFIPGSGRSPGEGNGNPLQYSCLENPMDGGTW